MDILSQAYAQFASEHVGTPPEPFRQNPQLKAAINNMSRESRQEGTRGTGEGGCVLPRRRMNFEEVSQIVEGHLNPALVNRGMAELQPEQALQSAINEKRALIAKIQRILNEVNRSAEDGEIPKLIIRNQKLWSNCIYDLDRVTLKSSEVAKKTVVTYSAETSRFNTIIFVLTKVHELLSKNLTCTRRELYYQNVTRLRSQSILDAAVRDVCCLLETPPWLLGISASGKGLVAGPLIMVTKDGSTVDCMTTGGTLIQQDVIGIKSLKTTAKYILVVEKDAIFQKLLDEGALERLTPVIILTGKGYPDVCTRQLLVRLTTELRLPALALVDCDPHGLEIFLTYKYGSLAQSHISSALACGRLALVGARCQDVRALAPVAARLPLSQLDIRKLRALIQRPYLNTPQGAALLAEARCMLQNGYKAELESIAALSSAYLTDSYLPAKIIAQDFIILTPSKGGYVETALTSCAPHSLAKR